MEIFDGTTRTYFSGIEREEAMQIGMWEEEGYNLAFDREKSNFGFNDILASFHSSDGQTRPQVRLRFDGERYNFERDGAYSACLSAPAPVYDEDQPPPCPIIGAQVG